jgi:hypothetical protein
LYRSLLRDLNGIGDKICRQFVSSSGTSWEEIWERDDMRVPVVGGKKQRKRKREGKEEAAASP